MPDREKVIRGLEACNRQSYNGSDCQNCPYYDDEDTAELPFGICNIQDMFDDALALLREQEPRVMTFEEIKDNMGVPVWVEYADNENWNGYGVPTSDHKAYIMIYGANAYCAQNARSHNVKWRAWTSRPSEQQMRDTKWEGENETM